MVEVTNKWESLLKPKEKTRTNTRVRRLGNAVTLPQEMIFFLDLEKGEIAHTHKMAGLC